MQKQPTEITVTGLPKTLNKKYHHMIKDYGYYDQAHDLILKEGYDNSNDGRCIRASTVKDLNEALKLVTWIGLEEEAPEASEMDTELEEMAEAGRTAEMNEIMDFINDLKGVSEDLSEDVSEDVSEDAILSDAEIIETADEMHDVVYEGYVTSAKHAYDYMKSRYQLTAGGYLTVKGFKTYAEMAGFSFMSKTYNHTVYSISEIEDMAVWARFWDDYKQVKLDDKAFRIEHKTNGINQYIEYNHGTWYIDWASSDEAFSCAMSLAQTMAEGIRRGEK